MSDSYKFNPDEILSPDEEVIHEQNKTIKRLQEQLKEANEVIKEYADSENWNDYYCQYSGNVVDDKLFYCSNGWETARNYLEKWGVK